MWVRRLSVGPSLLWPLSPASWDMHPFLRHCLSPKCCFVHPKLSSSFLSLPGMKDFCSSFKKSLQPVRPQGKRTFSSLTAHPVQEQSLARGSVVSSSAHDLLSSPATPLHSLHHTPRDSHSNRLRVSVTNFLFTLSKK